MNLKQEYREKFTTFNRCVIHMEKDEDRTWGVLLIDARNTFNEGNRKMIMWIARHKGLSRSNFLLCLHTSFGTSDER